jgi:fibronectin-binding autotransporter adhesin
MATMNYGFTADLAPSVKGPMPTAVPADRFAVWGQGYGSWGRSDSDGNAAKLTRSTGGFLLGADVAVFDNLRFGVVAGYSRSSST